MTDQGHKKDWRELCQAAAIEEDPDKLMELIDEINKALGELHRNPEFTVENKDKSGGNSSPIPYASLP